MVINLEPNKYRKWLHSGIIALRRGFVSRGTFQGKWIWGRTGRASFYWSVGSVVNWICDRVLKSTWYRLLIDFWLLKLISGPFLLFPRIQLAVWICLRRSGAALEGGRGQTLRNFREHGSKWTPKEKKLKLRVNAARAGYCFISIHYDYYCCY